MIMLNPEWYLLQMNKKIKCLTFIFILFTNCSFDHVTGIWDASEDEKERIINLEKEEDKRVDVVKIYSTENKRLKTSTKLNRLNSTRNNGTTNI